MGISAATGQGVKELMRRMNSFMDSMPVREESKDGLFTEDEERVDFSKEEDDNSFEIFTDENFPGQFRVVGNKIERVSDLRIVLMLNLMIPFADCPYDELELF